MRPIQRTYSPSDQDPDGYVAAGAGASVTLITTAPGDGLAHLVSFTSSGDLTGTTFTISGKDADGFALSEAVTGPSTELVASTSYFSEVTAIALSGSISSSVDIGWVDEFVTPTVPLDTYSDDAGVRVVVAGTIDYTVQHTLSDIQHVDSPFDWADSDSNASGVDVSDITASVNFAFDTIPIGLRLQANSYSSGAGLTLFIVHTNGL